APEIAITARIFRRVRIPAYRAARGESPSTCASKPNRVRVYSTHRRTAASTASPAPSGSGMPPCVWIVHAGHSAFAGRSLLFGNTLALNPVVSRQYEFVLKTRYVSRYAAT